jgi:hypothetical protein
MKAPYKLVYRTINGKQRTLDGYDCHATKSSAGILFQSHSVKNVRVLCIKNKRLFLRLCKNKKGKVLQHLTVNVPSQLAKFE